MWQKMEAIDQEATKKVPSTGIHFRIVPEMKGEYATKVAKGIAPVESFAPKLGKNRYFGCRMMTLGAEMIKGASPLKMALLQTKL